MIITHSKGRGKKIHILIDGEYQITTDIDFWAENFYKDGEDISEEEWKNLTDKIYYKKAVDKCYDLLSRRDHSVKELKTKLLRTVDEDNAGKAIQKMLDYGYLDDEKYARNLVNYLSKSKNMSYTFIKQELYKRGISGDIASYALEDIEVDNVSSIISLESPITPAPSTNFSQSASERFPVLRAWASTLDSRENIRFTSCSFDISKENMATAKF